MVECLYTSEIKMIPHLCDSSGMPGGGFILFQSATKDRVTLYFVVTARLPQWCWRYAELKHARS